MSKALKRPPRFGQRACPVCGERMEVVAQGKVEIEVCEAHGVWLDKGELEAITESRARFERLNSRAARRRAVGTAIRDAKIKGWLLGPFSLFVD